MIDIFESIRKCRRCNLHNNQLPLLDDADKCDVMWVGLSAKIVKDINYDKPLSKSTHSGKIINDIENKFKEINFYKTNLVKCVPLMENKKLRYPDVNEMEHCFEHFINEVKKLNPKIVFLLGNKVSKFVYSKFGISNFNYNKIFDYNGIKYISVYHPSYIYVYKRKEILQYEKNIIKVISDSFIK